MSKDTDYKVVVVKKPWGHEYLVYENENLGIWYLNIENNQSTSLHCHPKKNTGFVILDGKVNIKFLRGEMTLEGLDKIHINRGRFHSTTCVGENSSHILEIESPQDKHDLVRLEDAYGRSSQPYENSDHHIERNSTHLWLKEGQEYEFNRCKLHILDVQKDYLVNSKDEEIFVFLRGSIYNSEESGDIIQPGDVVTGDIMRLIAKKFQVKEKTTVLKVERL